MPNMKPISDLKNDTAAVNEASYENRVYVTHNGYGSCAIMDMQELDEQDKQKALNQLIVIRPENPSEYGEVNKIIYKAFAEQYGAETGKFMMEHFIKERQKETFIPELSLVAVLGDGTIVGEVAIHETDIATENGNNTQLVLSQSAVLPGYRMQGIMRMLVEHALNKARTMGYGAVFLGGNPKLYARFGFEPSSKYGIYHEDRKKWGDEGFMVCILKSGALDGVTGTTSYYGG